MPTYRVHVIDENGAYLPGYFVAVLPGSGDKIPETNLQDYSYPIWYTATDATATQGEPLVLTTPTARTGPILQLAGPSNPKQPEVYNYFFNVPLRGDENADITFRILDIPDQELATIPKNFTDRFPRWVTKGDPANPKTIKTAEFSDWVQQEIAEANAQVQAQIWPTLDDNGNASFDLGRCRVTIRVRGPDDTATNYLCRVYHHDGSLPVAPVVEVGEEVTLVIRAARHAVFVQTWPAGQAATQTEKHRIFPLTGGSVEVTRSLQATPQRHEAWINAPAQIAHHYIDGSYQGMKANTFIKHGQHDNIHSSLAASIARECKTFAEAWVSLNHPGAQMVRLLAYENAAVGGFQIGPWGGPYQWKALTWSQAKGLGAEVSISECKVEKLLVEWWL